MKAMLKRFDYLMFAVMLGLIAIGTVAIRSAGTARAEAVFHEMWIANLVTAAFGLAIYLLIAFTDYRKWLDIMSVPVYGLSLAFLVAVLVFGSTVYGGKRWLWFFQPSEVAKLGVIMMMAAQFGRRDDDDLRVFGFRNFLLALAIVAVPVALILAEPDLGTALTLIPAVVVMMFVAGIWRRGLVTVLAVCGIGLLAVLGMVYEAERPGTPPERRELIMKFMPLKPHQFRRVKVFLFPEEDKMGAGYNLRQAKISIGSGGFSGKGIGKGEANHLKYLPQAISMNDFIFCVYAEETGFVGSSVLLALFTLLLVSGCRIAFVTSDPGGRLLALGVSTLIFAHVYINIAMSLGLVPITGLPLPFISSGRTFLVTMMCALGFVQSISTHRNKEKQR